jgi:hypothetical protein
MNGAVAPIVYGAAAGIALLLLQPLGRVLRSLKAPRSPQKQQQPRAPLDGSHEACDLAVREELLWERIASRDAGLGAQITKDVIQ